jgi:hypothetical protein
MKHTQERHSSLPVAAMDGLAEEDSRLIRYLREWYEGPDARRAIWREMTQALGPDGARDCLHAFDDLVTMLIEQGRRVLMRHHSECNRVGADEAIFANFVRTAGMGEREDAMLIATLLLRPDYAPAACALAEMVGLSLARATRSRATLTREAAPAADDRAGRMFAPETRYRH